MGRRVARVSRSAGPATLFLFDSEESFLVRMEFPCVVLWRPEAPDCRVLIPPDLEWAQRPSCPSNPNRTSPPRCTRAPPAAGWKSSKVGFSFPCHNHVLTYVCYALCCTVNCLLFEAGAAAEPERRPPCFGATLTRTRTRTREATRPCPTQGMPRS